MHQEWKEEKIYINTSGLIVREYLFLWFVIDMDDVLRSEDIGAILVFETYIFQDVN